MSKPTVLFVCIHNAGRSQMAAALLAHHGGDRVVVRSAGTAPADTINPAVVDRKSTRLNSSHSDRSRMPSSA